jgi:hypothetical protein
LARYMRGALSFFWQIPSEGRYIIPGLHGAASAGAANAKSGIKISILLIKFLVGVGDVSEGNIVVFPAGNSGPVRLKLTHKALF